MSMSDVPETDKSLDEKYKQILMINEISEELEHADKKYGPMMDPLEGWHTLNNEMGELRREIDRFNKDYHSYYREILQVAAMGLKLFRDCSSKEDFEKLLSNCKC